MTSKDERERLHALLWALADSLDHESGAGAERSATASGDADRVRALLLDGIQAGKKRRLADARAQHAEAVAAYRGSTSRLPSSAGDRRRLLGQVMERPKVKELVLTIQHRELRDMNDDDVESLLRQLEHLGVLDNLASKKSP